MAHIKEITVTAAKGCIPSDFKIDDLPRLLVITGKNNSGKSTFMRLITPIEKGGLGKGKFLSEEGEDIKPTVVYIAAENILPSEGEAKTSAKGSPLVKNLAALFENLGVSLQLKQKPDIDTYMSKLGDLATQNMQEFTESPDHGMELSPKSEPDSDAIVQLLLEKMQAKEGGEPRGFKDLGQGTQRLMVAALLKAYSDVLDQQEGEGKQPATVLVLFEEPEIYLHPELKKTLNEALVEIANKTDHQVIISTHDPFFAYTNMDSDDSRVVAFVKENGTTKPEPQPGNSFTGVEDELLHIHLFDKAMRTLTSRDTKLGAGNEINRALIEAGSSTRKYSMDGKRENEDGLDYALPLYIRHIIHHRTNNEYVFSGEDLEESIKILSHAINKKA